MSDYYGAIEGALFAAIALGLAGWQLWSLRDHKIDRDDDDNNQNGK